MKKRFVCFLLALCLVAALLPVSALAADLGTLTNPWDLGGGIKAALVDGYELHIFGAGDYQEPADAPWKSQKTRITSVVIESDVLSLKMNGTKAPFEESTSMTAMTVQRSTNGTQLDVENGCLDAALKVHLVVSGTAAMPGGAGGQLWADFIPNIYSVEIKEGVASVGNMAFSGCSHLTAITIPSTVTSIGQRAFEYTSLANVTLKHDFTRPLTIGTNAFPSDVKINVEITKSDNSWNYASVDDQPWKNYRNNIINVTFNAEAAHIARNVFADCNSLKTITLKFQDPDDGTLKAEKSFGANWLWHVDEKNYVINVQAISSVANHAFKIWNGDDSLDSQDLAFVNAREASTYLEYMAEDNTVRANWQNTIVGIKLEPKEGKNFGELEVGYSTVDLYTVTVTNTGNTASGELTVQLTGGNVSAFQLSKKTINSLALNGSDTFTVSPAASQKEGSYSTTVSVTNNAGEVIGFFPVRYNVGTSYSRAERFVKRFYQTILGREGEADGVTYWTNKIVNKETTAAEVAAGFFASAEALNKKRSDDAFVETLYLSMMDRASDAGGKANWLGQLKAGKTRAWVFKQFVDSAEFKNLCNYYSLTAGTIDPSKYNMGASTSDGKEATEAVLAFVERLYTIALGRPSDAAGKADWSNQLATKKNTGAGVAAGFFGSTEYRNRNRSNTEFLNDLYKVMFNRDIDATGASTWGNALKNGKTRSYVFQQLCGSVEFANLCSKTYGITAGTIDPSKYNMGSWTPVPTQANADAYVTRLYQEIMGRTPNAEEVKTWSDKLIARSMSASQVAAGFYVSGEYASKSANATAFVTSLYKSLLARDGSAADIAAYAKKITDGATPGAVFAEFCNSTEFKNLCNSVDLTAGTVAAKTYTIAVTK